MVTTTKRPLFEAIDYPICDYIHRKTAMEKWTEPVESEAETIERLKKKIERLEYNLTQAELEIDFIRKQSREEIDRLKTENGRLKHEITSFQDQAYSAKYKLSEAKEELAKYRKDLTHLDDQLQESGEERERLESIVADYKRRFGEIVSSDP